MAERKLCPLALVGVVQDECAEVHRAWWHGGVAEQGGGR